jgi:hypothetical protein
MYVGNVRLKSPCDLEDATVRKRIEDSGAERSSFAAQRFIEASARFRQESCLAAVSLGDLGYLSDHILFSGERAPILVENLEYSHLVRVSFPW